MRMASGEPPRLEQIAARRSIHRKLRESWLATCTQTTSNNEENRKAMNVWHRLWTEGPRKEKA